MMLSSLVYLLLVSSIAAEKRVKFLDSKFTTNPKFFQNSSCNVNTKSKDWVVFDLIAPLSNLTIVAKLEYLNTKSILINESLNLCKTLNARVLSNYSFFLKFIWNILNKYSNVFVCKLQVR